MVAAEFDQRDHGVQPVRGLVRLRAERVGEAAYGVQLAGQRLEFGVVAECHHGAETRADGRGVEHHHPLCGEMHLVAHRRRAHQGPRKRLGQTEIRHRQAVQLAGEAEEFACRVVAEHHPLPLVEQHQSLAHRVQRRLVVVVQVAQLGRAHAVGVPPQPGAHQVAAEAAERQRGERDAGQFEQLEPQPGTDRPDLDPRTDQRDHVPLPVEHRRDHPDGRAERAGVRLREGLPGQRPVDVAQERLADLRGVAVRQPDAVGVHHSHEVHAGVLPDLLHVRLEHLGGVGPGDGVTDTRRVGHGPGGGGDLPDGGVLGPVGGEQVREHRAARDHGGHDHDLHREQLAREAAAARRAVGAGGHTGQCAGSPISQGNHNRGARLG